MMMMLSSQQHHYGMMRRMMRSSVVKTTTSTTTKKKYVATTCTISRRRYYNSSSSISRIVVFPRSTRMGSLIVAARSRATTTARKNNVMKVAQRRQLFDSRQKKMTKKRSSGSKAVTAKKAKKAPRSVESSKPIIKAPVTKWDETSIAQRGPIPNAFYIKHNSTILQPQYSGKSAWGGLGLLTGINFVVLGMWNTKSADPNETEIQRKADNDKKEEWMMENFTTNVTNVVQGRPWTLGTASISHIDLGHFGGNMFAMWLFGFNTYRVIGGFAFYGLYAVGGVVCSCTHVLHNVLTGKTQPPLTQQERESLELYASEYGAHAIDQLPPEMTERLARADKPSLGASGSVMSIAAVAAALFPLDQMRYRNLYVPLPVAAGIFILSDLSGLISEGSPTDHAGHLGGLLAGALYVTMAWYSKRLGGFQILRNITGGDLPIVYRWRQMMSGRGGFGG